MYPPSYLSDKQLAERYQIARVSVWRWIKENHFPKPVKLGPGCTRWRYSDILEWEKKREAKK